MDDIAFLNATNIVKLQSAARMAGLSWKSGDPAFNKAGIIEKLQRHPSIMRAAIACLQRIEGNTPKIANPSDFLNEIESEQKTEEKNDSNPKAQSGEAQPDSEQLRGLTQALANSLTTTERNFGLIRADIRVLKSDFQSHSVKIDFQESRLAQLESRRPIEITLPDLRKIEIPPTAHKSYAKLITYLQVNRRVILTGSAGTGKSMAAHNAAKDLGVEFHLQTPITMDHQYLGHRDAQGVFHETPTFKAYTQGGLLLWDEADAGLPDAMLGANPIFDGNGFATFGDGNMYPQHPDFFAIFNMNTDGNGATMQYAGRSRLDGATLARFGVRIHWEIDDAIESAMALGNHAWHNACKAVREFMTARGIVDVNATPRHVKTGAALLQSGCKRDEVFSDVLKSGALSEVWTDVLKLSPVAQFIRGF